MNITSSEFFNSGRIPDKFTCKGEDTSPPLTIEEVPTDAKSLVLIVDDPDAPNGTFTHWVVWNINPKTVTIGEGEVPAGAIEGKNSLGENGYTGPCPPTGTHRYFFKLLAIKLADLGLPAEATVEEVMKQTEGQVINYSTLIGTYSK